MELNIKHQVTGETSGLSAPIDLYRGKGGGGSGACSPGKKFGKFDSLKPHILHSLDRKQLIYKCILSQSLVIHDSRAEVQRFMISKCLTQRFMILTCFISMIHDS